MIRMATVDQALGLLAEHGARRRPGTETAPLSRAQGRRLAEPVRARLSQPPAAVSAMDGYAVRHADAAAGTALKLIGESRAGSPYEGQIGALEAVRIFTGAVVPAGADHILIQEEAGRDGQNVTVLAVQPAPANIRRAGRDFSEGDVLIPAGQIITEGAISLAASGNAPQLVLACAPRIGVLATGDELIAPGETPAPGQVVNSIQPALLALLSRWGAVGVDLGVSRDREEEVIEHISAACDVIVSIGGASVGDYDVVRSAFAARGFDPVFEKVAVKPGKPTWFSAGPAALALGLPGNPAAAMVTAHLFLRPLIMALTGGPADNSPLARAHTHTALPASGAREEYLRAVLSIGPDGRAGIRAADDQDSSLLSPFLTANALIRRPVHAPGASPGELVDFIPLA